MPSADLVHPDGSMACGQWGWQTASVGAVTLQLLVK